MIEAQTQTGTLDGILQAILRQRCISRQTQQQLMRALFSSGDLSDRETAQVNRIFDAVSRGQIRVTD